MLIKKKVDGDIVRSHYKSSNLLVSEYDQTNKDLTITFKNGGQYKYIDVSPTDYMRFELADSQGKVLNSKIKPNYKFENLGKVDVSLMIEEINKVDNEEKKEYQSVVISAMKGMIQDWDDNDEEFSDAKLDKVVKFIEKYKEKINS
jgi:hypothetical protein